MPIPNLRKLKSSAGELPCVVLGVCPNPLRTSTTGRIGRDEYRRCGVGADGGECLVCGIGLVEGDLYLVCLRCEGGANRVDQNSI